MLMRRPLVKWSRRLREGLACVLLNVSLAAVWGRPGDGGEAVPGSSELGLALSATTPRAEILVCEPLVLGITITNQSRREVPVRPLEHVSDMAVTITDPSGLSVAETASRI